VIDPPHILGPSTVLGPGGTIARTLPGYEARHQQLKMAEAVAHQVPRPDRRGRRLTAPGRPTRPVAALPGDRPETTSRAESRSREPSGPPAATILARPPSGSSGARPSSNCPWPRMTSWSP